VRGISLVRADPAVKLRRLELIVTLALGLLVAPLAAEAQQRARIPRIGVLFPVEPSASHPNLAAFRQALRELGHVEEQTVAIEYRYGHGKTERFTDLTAELARLKVDIMVVGSTQAALAAKKATQTIPIVFVGGVDPVGVGLVTSFARPGGHITGLSFAYEEGFGGKWVQLLKEAAPKVTRVAVLRHETDPASAWYWPDMQKAARVLGLALQPLTVREPDQLVSVFSAMTKERAGAVIVDSSPFLSAHFVRVVDLAARHRLPAVFHNRRFVDAGGLMSYGVNLADLWRRAATYVDKILKGARPADLPVEQPTKFELVINLKTAKALGLTIPQTLLLRADQVIE
jgi:putative ABC transport system substrate-binding protein